MFLLTCGAAQEKQSAAVLPSSTPPAGFLAVGHDGRHPKNWLSGVQAAGTTLEGTAFVKVGTSAVATFQTPLPGNVGPVYCLSAGPFTQRAALWLHRPFVSGCLSPVGFNAVSKETEHADRHESWDVPLRRRLLRAHSPQCHEHEALL